MLDIVRDVVEYHDDVATAVDRPRMHMQWLPDVVYAEPETFAPAVSAQLASMGYTLKLGRAGSDANAVAIATDGTRTAAHDPRNVTGRAVAF